MNNEIQQMARNAEKSNDWREAERLWVLAGRKLDAEACKMIYEATDRGDHYRARVLNEAGPEPNKDENPENWSKWYEHMHKIYREVYVTE
jgi:hypothetical protein